MPWDPLTDVQAWRDRLDRLANPHPESWAPPIDVYETGDAYVVLAEVPGLAREQIAVELNDDRLTIRGERAGGPAGADVVHYHQVERGHGAFVRSFEFAEKIDGEHVVADLANGILSVTLRKLPPAAARRISVK
ncbi:MAG TPA: Hsp20/alpha crystallin family protein [Vicinamibacterales bacterium]|nr:Hsp20/alpha crystallin family protein [Vicinamibacterales bacterium]